MCKRFNAAFPGEITSGRQRADGRYRVKSISPNRMGFIPTAQPVLGRRNSCLLLIGAHSDAERLRGRDARNHADRNRKLI